MPFFIIILCSIFFLLLFKYNLKITPIETYYFYKTYEKTTLFSSIHTFYTFFFFFLLICYFIFYFIYIEKYICYFFNMYKYL